MDGGPYDLYAGARLEVVGNFSSLVILPGEDLNCSWVFRVFSCLGAASGSTALRRNGLGCSASICPFIGLGDELCGRVEVVGSEFESGANNGCDRSLFVGGIDGSEVFEHCLPKHSPRLRSPWSDLKFRFDLESGINARGRITSARVLKTL